MEREEALVVDETVLSEEEIEPFNWEDHLQKSWLEEHLEKGNRKPAEVENWI